MAKLRIISGEFGGRFISANVSGATHPMGDRVRSGLFNLLNSRNVLKNAEILDAFAGTGSLGFESLSRGAKFATFIEREKTAQNVIVENITTLNVENRAKLIKTGVETWLNRAENTYYDIIFADPPYQNAQFSTVSRLAGALRKNGLMILSYMSGETAPKPDGVVVVDNRIYGEASLVIYRKIS